MDWATSFKDNSQSLFTLGGVFLGSLITFIINYLNLRTQSKERDKDRQEQRREARTQLALELRRNDIAAIELSIDSYLMGVGEMRRIRAKYSGDDDAKDKIRTEFDLKLVEDDSFYRLVHRNMAADKLVYSLGEELYLEYTSYLKLFRDYLTMVFELEREKDAELTSRLISSAAKLHNMLSEKLISLRDTT